MSHGHHHHGHGHGRGLARPGAAGRDSGPGQRALVWVLGLTIAFTVAEFVGGWIANSLALVADAAHMLADVASLALSLFALWFARRPAPPEKSFGYVRLEILAALVNGALLLVLAAGIVWEAIRRFGSPQPVQSGIMIGVASAGLLANIVSAIVLHRSAGDSLNIRGAYLHVLGDLFGSAGAILAGVLIATAGWLAADPLISVLVAALIVGSSWKLLRESVDVLLEAVPAHIDMGEVRRAMDEIPGVEDVHDLHVWTVTSGFLAMSGHAVVREPAGSQAILDEIHARMRQRFGIRHATIQIECRPPVQLRGPER
jgi:cobalt-zinc-cadmium efflux system protein